ncbi:MAG: flagellar hook assembly protein FlgD [Candidatus Tectimicrobiota bacterium]
MNSSISSLGGSLRPTNASTTAPGLGGLKESPKEAFLNLLVAQLEHQNPLEPVENTEFTAQLAQFTSLEQLQTMNTNLSALATAQSTANGLQASALIGKQVQAQGNATHVDQDGGTQPLHYQLAAESATVQIAISNAAGQTVRTLNLGKQPAGVQDIKWNGKDDQGKTLPEGDYRFAVTATDQAGRAVAADISLSGTVESVTYVNKNPYLIVGGNRVELSDITRVQQNK